MQKDPQLLLVYIFSFYSISYQTLLRLQEQETAVTQFRYSSSSTFLTSIMYRESLGKYLEIRAHSLSNIFFYDLFSFSLHIMHCTHLQFLLYLVFIYFFCFFMIAAYANIILITQGGCVKDDQDCPAIEVCSFLDLWNKIDKKWTS